MTADDRLELERLTHGVPELQDVVELYTHANGVDLFEGIDPDSGSAHFAMTLLPVGLWVEEATPWKPGGETADFMEGCELYNHGEWHVIATLSDERMSLVQFRSGAYEGMALAGRIFCLGLDGYLGFEEEVAPNLSALMEEIAGNPVGFFDRLGFTPTVASDAGYFGDPIEAYVADVRGHPNALPWPSPKPQADS